MTKREPAPARKGTLPPALLLVAILLQLLLHALWPIGRWLEAPWNWLGTLPLGVGLLVTVAADRQFKRVRTAISPYAMPTTLVCEGPFARSRNPMYLGLVTLLVGTGVLLGTVTPMVVPPLYAMVLDLRFIRHEEQVLLECFGEDYVAYTRRVRRWL